MSGNEWLLPRLTDPHYVRLNVRGDYGHNPDRMVTCRPSEVCRGAFETPAASLFHRPGWGA